MLKQRLDTPRVDPGTSGRGGAPAHPACYVGRRVRGRHTDRAGPPAREWQGPASVWTNEASCPPDAGSWPEGAPVSPAEPVKAGQTGAALGDGESPSHAPILLPCVLEPGVSGSGIEEEELKIKADPSF